MSGAASVDRVAASRLVTALEHAWTAIRSHHPDLPRRRRDDAGSC